MEWMRIFRTTLEDFSGYLLSDIQSSIRILYIVSSNPVNYLQQYLSFCKTFFSSTLVMISDTNHSNYSYFFLTYSIPKYLYILIFHTTLSHMLNRILYMLLFSIYKVLKVKIYILSSIMVLWLFLLQNDIIIVAIHLPNQWSFWRIWIKKFGFDITCFK